MLHQKCPDEWVELCLSCPFANVSASCLVRTPVWGQEGCAHREEKEVLCFLTPKVLKDLQRKLNFPKQVDVKWTVWLSQLWNGYRQDLCGVTLLFYILLLYFHHLILIQCTWRVFTYREDDDNVDLQLYFCAVKCTFNQSKSTFSTHTRWLMLQLIVRLQLCWSVRLLEKMEMSVCLA